MAALRLSRRRSLLPGTLLRRYQRFLADVRLDDGREVTAHCVNTGAMEGLTEPGTRVWLSEAENPRRRTAFTWELACVDGRTYGTNTALPNRLIAELMRRGALPWLGRWDEVRTEVRFAERRRVDLELRRGGRDHGRGGARRMLLEVKNCHLLYPDGRAYFPDSVSERARHHLEALADAIDRSTRAAVLFVCQMAGVEAVRPSDAHDPAFAAAARAVRRRGVRFFALQVRHTPKSILLDGRRPVELRPYQVEPVRRWREAARAAGRARCHEAGCPSRSSPALSEAKPSAG